MGNAKLKPYVLISGNHIYELESRHGGYGTMLDRQKGEIKEGLFFRSKHHRRPLLNGLLYLRRNRANRQTYAGIYFDQLMSSGRIFYSGESQTPDQYCGSHNQFARHGFGEYKEQDKWRYIGFWTNETMDGIGRYTNKVTNESFMGVFQDNSFSGWGSYERVKEHKVLKQKSTGKQFKGTEYVQICSYFQLQNMENPEKSKKTIKTEDGNSIYEAFPRLEEVFFKAGNTTHYILQLFTEYHNRIVNIRRVGKDTYHILSIKPTKIIKVISRAEMLRLPDYNTFSEECKKLIEGSMDPDFVFNDVEYHIARVQEQTGLKSRYLVRCDFEEEELGMRFSQNYRGDRSSTFIAKAYIVANDNEISIRRHELKMLKIAQKKRLVPPLAVCHQDPLKQDVLLSYSRMQNLHSNEIVAHDFPKKYIIMTEELRDGEFLDAVLGFRGMSRHKVLRPLDRIILISKILDAYSALQSLYIYHGQIFPCHIYIKGLHTDISEDWEIKLVDFSEAVYVGGNEPESRFESASNDAGKKLARNNPFRRFYVHKMYRCPREQRMFQHPLFYYFVHNHFDIPLQRLFFDIRHTDLYSLVVIILILLAPSLQTEDAIKKKLEQHNEECFEDYSVNLGQYLNVKSKKYGEKSKIAIVQDILTKTYSMNDEIQENIDGLVQDLLDTMKNCTPNLRAHQTLSETASTTTFMNVKFALKDNLNQLIEHFEQNEFKLKPGKDRIFGKDEMEEFHRTIANRLLGALNASSIIEEVEEQKKTSIFDRYFGREWQGKELDQEVDDEYKETESMQVVPPDGEAQIYQTPSQGGVDFLGVLDLSRSGRRFSTKTKKQNGVSLREVIPEEEEEKLVSKKVYEEEGNNITLTVSSVFDDEDLPKTPLNQKKAPALGIELQLHELNTDREIQSEKLPQKKKGLSNKDRMMLQGISRRVKRSTTMGLDRILTPRQKAGFPWGKNDKYGGIIFEFKDTDRNSDQDIKEVYDLTDEED